MCIRDSFYAGSPASDKLSGNAVSRALANRLYIDWFYDKVLVRGIQDVYKRQKRRHADCRGPQPEHERGQAGAGH